MGTDNTADATPAITAKPGWETTEFYITILTALLPVTTAIFHRDFTNQVQPFAVIAAGVATSVYTIARAHSKHAALKANADVQVAKATTAATPTTIVAPTITTPSEGSQANMATVPLDTLASILAKLDRLIDEQPAVAR